jgi:multisubunit Na+/H+ antiporter MnhE subunit
MRKLAKFLPLFFIIFGVLFVFWIIFVGTFSRPELLVGFFAALLGGIGISVVQHADDAHFRPRVRHWLEFVRVPWYVVTGTWTLFLVTVKDVLGVKRAESLFRLATFDAGDECDPVGTGRRVLAIAYTTISPNFIVLGINVRDRFMLFHQVDRSPVLQLDKDLGARS